MPRIFVVALAPLVTAGLLGTGIGAVPTGATTGGTAAAPAATAIPPHDSAYWLVGSNGQIYAFGGATTYGSMGGQPLNEPIVGLASTPTGTGYWEVAADGGIFSFGKAAFHGSMGGHPLNEPIVGIAADPATGGYWEVASDGGIFSFTAPFYGSMGGHPLNQPVVGMAATPTGGGYWEVAADGGIFSFGNATFYGSTGSLHLVQPVVGMTALPTGTGYWLVASDGGLFSFGGASNRFFGSLGGQPQRYPIAGMAALSNGLGYWMTNSNGAVTSFGTATYWGSGPQQLPAPIVGMAPARGNGDPGSTSYQSGSYGYDISVWQCGNNFPPNPHTIGVVQVEGGSDDPLNGCFATEVAWAGGGLNLYTFLTFGTTATLEPGCATTPAAAACDFGYDAVLNSYGKARAVIGTEATVPWWLDIEGPGLYWSATVAENASLIQGAIDALRSAGINTVGIYASPYTWPRIAGDYRPPVAYFAADWAKTNPATLCIAVPADYSDIPSGPVELVQYGAPTYPYQAGGMDTLFDNDYAC